MSDIGAATGRHSAIAAVTAGSAGVGVREWVIVERECITNAAGAAGSAVAPLGDIADDRVVV